MENITVKCNKNLTYNDYCKFGLSMLEGKLPKITDNATGEKPITKHAGDMVVEDPNAARLCTYRDDFKYHMDILCDSADIVYDIGRLTDVDKIYICSMATVVHSLADFAIFGAKTEDALFNKENKIYHFDRTENKDESETIDWLLEGKLGTFRYFGIRIYKASLADDIIRIGQIGLFNSEYHIKAGYLFNTYKENLIAGLEPANATDGVLHENTVSIDGEETFSYTFDEEKTINKVVIIAKDKFDAFIDNFSATLCTRTEIENGLTEAVFADADVTKKLKEISIKITGKCEIHQIIVYSDYKPATVDFDNVINDDFYSVGACLIPTAFMPESIELGYNDTYWELEKLRFRRAKPSAVRVWFQVDWVVTEYENYKNGVYDFNNQKMQSVYKYFDLLKEIGTEIEFNFGWKIAEEAQEWFALKEVTNKRASAPAELDLFAKCCANVLEELIVNRGYDNIKYLTFYNEPDHVDTDEYGDHGYDFHCYGTGVSRREYWRQMLVACKQEIEKKNLDIKYWGCEVSSSLEKQKKFTEYMTTEHTGLLDMVTVHRYLLSSWMSEEYFTEMRKSANGLPIIVTECGQIYDGIYKYDKNHVQLFCDLANYGISGVFIWCITGIRFSMPSNFLMNNPIDFWHTPQIEGGIHRVMDNYYWWAMLSSYVPNHSKTVKSVCNDKDLRVASFTHGDDYTVVVELPEEGHTRNLDIKFAKSINKKMYKYVVELPVKRDANAILPTCVEEVYATDGIKDTLNGNYQEIVYSTIPPVSQVRVPAVEVFLKAGESYKLSGQVIDGINEGVTFEMPVNLGDFTLDGDTVTLNRANKGDMCAVKVISKADKNAYAVVIIKAQA